MPLASLGTFATVYRTIGLTLLAVVLVVAVTYVVVNVLFAGRAELGSEIELAANRKPYYDDETLEGKKLDRTLTLGLLTLFVLAVGLPIYWIREPARQENAAEGFGERFIHRGELMFAATGENAEALNCAGCHGGLEGGVVQDYVLQQPDGSVEVVDWRAPALNTVLLRYSRDEVRYILTYGRPGTPMPAWGVDGGGALNEQQIQSIIDFLDANQLSPEEAQQQAAETLDKYMAARFEDGDRVFETEGEALFNLGLLDNFAGGAYSCARCHTAGWAYAQVETSTDDNGTPDDPSDDFIVVDRDSFEAATHNAGCGGSFGYNLCDGATERQFPERQDMVDFVSEGSEDGVGYGTRGQGSGKMPGFGVRPAEPAVWWLNGGEERPATGGMLTVEMIEAIVEYERTLRSATADSEEG